MNQKLAFRPDLYRTLARVLLILYWVALFTGTHWPNFHLNRFPSNFDKVLHFSGYGGLSFLIAVWLSTWREVSRRDLVRIFGVIVVYSIFDEVSQIPVGRTCDPFDAFADWAGCLAALSVFLLIRLAVRHYSTAVDEASGPDFDELSRGA